MSTPGSPVPLHLITGFLGSGKTTMLNHLLDEAAERGLRVGVIINEWGQVNIDANLVPTQDIEIEELNNGQLFCSCLAGNFVEALVLFADRPLDLVIVETSGMANPAPLRRLIGELRRLTGLHYDYRGMTALADPENFLELAEDINAVEEQIIGSQRIVINKVDLSEPETLSRIRAKIRELNPGAVIVETSYGKVAGFLDAPALPPEGAAFVMRKATKPYQRPSQFVISTVASLAPEKAEAFVRALLPKALRIKGLVFEQGRGGFYVDGVNERTSSKPLQAKAGEQGSKIVIIPKADQDLDEAQVTAAWQNNCGVEFSLA